MRRHSIKFEYEKGRNSQWSFEWWCLDNEFMYKLIYMMKLQCWLMLWETAWEQEKGSSGEMQ